MSDRARSETLDGAGSDRGVTNAKAMFLLAAGLSFLLSVSFYFTGDHERGIFVGIWVPSILSAGSLLLGSARHD